MVKAPGQFGFLSALVRIVRGRPHVPPAVADNPLLQRILRRRSVRRYDDRPLPDEVFAAILEAARVAPSTVNLQTWSFALFTAESWRATFGRPIPFQAQRAVIVLADTHRARTVFEAFPRSPLIEYTIGVMNAALAAMNMTLAAEALGVSSVMLSETGRSGLLDAAYLKDKLGLPDGVVPLMTIVFGYAKGPRPPMPPRLPLQEICFTGCYRETDPLVMRRWLEEMIAGYKAAFPRSSFEAQLHVYRSRIGQAEQELRRLVLGDDTN
ncbi:MAG: nitroreductase family protein [Anaerolineae bacterium]|nr:nitroreductase family protein [Thermoflexales bacterium]MDW8407974.1 nitroreductase family protein [Anaerolineae bacterium]